MAPEFWGAFVGCDLDHQECTLYVIVCRRCSSEGDATTNATRSSESEEGALMSAAMRLGAGNLRACHVMLSRARCYLSICRGDCTKTVAVVVRASYGEAGTAREADLPETYPPVVRGASPSPVLSSSGREVEQQPDGGSWGGTQGDVASKLSEGHESYNDAGKLADDEVKYEVSDAPSESSECGHTGDLNTDCEERFPHCSS